jgi:hypothetical protein
MALIEAHITKVEKEVGSEWGAIHTDHGTVKKLTTKMQDKLSEAAQLKQSGVLAGIEYTEKVRTVDGRTYRNFYYERAGSLGSNGSSAADGIDIVQPQQQVGRADPPEKKWSIALQGAAKLAVWTLPLMPEGQRDFETQKQIAQAWAEFFFFSEPPTARAQATSHVMSSSHGAYSDPDGIEQPPPPDDPFPF